MNTIISFHGLGVENLLLLFAGTVDLVFSVLIYLTGRGKQKSILFSLFGVSVSAWAFSMVVFNITTDAHVFYMATTWLYVFAACAACFFFFFCTSLKNGVIDLGFYEKLFAIISFILIFIFVMIPNFVIIVPQKLLVKELHFGYGYFLYGIYIISYFSTGLVSLFREYKRSTSFFTKKQIFFLTVGTFTAIIIGVNTNLIFPFFGQWKFFWFGPVATVIIVIFVGYATIRHNLFNTKSIAVSSASFLLLVATIMRLFLSSGAEDFLTNGILFVFVAGGSLLLISSINKEVNTRESIEKIAEDLAVANEHLREIDKEKSEFVSIASHQLRTPLTAIKGYSSMLLEGSYGKLTQKIEEPINRIFQSSDRLALIIEDFLDISKIEQGRMTYQFATLDMRGLLRNMVEEMSPQATEKNLKLILKIGEGKSFNATADFGKIRQILSNLIDNAIKYSTDGEVSVSLSRDRLKGKILVSVHDTGVGISTETMGKLFQKFSRAEGIKKIYTEGSGLGLYVAQEMIKAHHGRIWAESEGEGHGSTFSIELMAED
jgi:signal transduction histidine kinase